MDPDPVWTAETPPTTTTALVVGDVTVALSTGIAGALTVYGVRLVVYEIAALDAVIVKLVPTNAGVVVCTGIVSIPVPDAMVTPDGAPVTPHTTGAARASVFVNVSVCAETVVFRT